jgi:RecJ-like exonuclease
MKLGRDYEFIIRRHSLRYIWRSPHGTWVGSLLPKCPWCHGQAYFGGSRWGEPNEDCSVCDGYGYVTPWSWLWWHTGRRVRHGVMWTFWTAQEHLKIACPWCDGAGWLERDSYSQEAPDPGYPCPLCHERGYVWRWTARKAKEAK